MRKTAIFVLGAVIVLSGLLYGAGKTPSEKVLVSPEGKIREDKKAAPTGKAKVTFIELGSVKCIPCKMMAPIIEEIKKEYERKVEVIFYDVWTEKGRPFGEKYNINVIPTQIFLDSEGKEIFRHEGFFPKEEIVKFLEKHGVM